MILLPKFKDGSTVRIRMDTKLYPDYPTSPPSFYAGKEGILIEPSDRSPHKGWLVDIGGKLPRWFAEFELEFL